MHDETDLAVVGTYTKEGGNGLVNCAVDDRTAEFKKLHITSEENPSFIACHPTGSFIIAVNEVDEGSIVTYAVDRETGTLTFLDRITTRNAGPCHVAFDPQGEFAVVSYYVDGSVALLSIDDEGFLFGPVDRHEHCGSSRHPERQTTPHPHSASFITESIIYVPDLGTDQVYIYELDRESSRLQPAMTPYIELPAGTGPRHLDIHPTESVGYLLNELDATVTVLDLTDPSIPKPVRNESTLPKSESAEGTIAADIQVHPNGEYVFASNRGHDSLTTFDIADNPDIPIRTDVRSCDGHWPRNFALSPSGDHIYTCNQRSDEVVSFAINSETGELVRDGEAASIIAPVCLVFV